MSDKESKEMEIDGAKTVRDLRQHSLRAIEDIENQPPSHRDVAID